MEEIAMSVIEKNLEGEFGDVMIKYCEIISENTRLILLALLDEKIDPLKRSHLIIAVLQMVKIFTSHFSEKISSKYNNKKFQRRFNLIKLPKMGDYISICARAVEGGSVIEFDIEATRNGSGIVIADAEVKLL